MQTEQERQEIRETGSWSTCRGCGYLTKGFNEPLNHAEKCPPCECWTWGASMFDKPVNGHHPSCPKGVTPAR